MNADIGLVYIKFQKADKESWFYTMTFFTKGQVVV